ncbi:hypothetical protein L9F63_028262, partial [Diploptera punctata]
VPIPNYTDIDISFSYDYFRTSLDFARMEHTTAYEMISQVIPVGNIMIDGQLSSPQVQEFIK